MAAHPIFGLSYLMSPRLFSNKRGHLLLRDQSDMFDSMTLYTIRFERWQILRWNSLQIACVDVKWPVQALLTSPFCGNHDVIFPYWQIPPPITVYMVILAEGKWCQVNFSSQAEDSPEIRFIIAFNIREVISRSMMSMRMSRQLFLPVMMVVVPP